MAFRRDHVTFRVFLLSGVLRIDKKSLDQILQAVCSNVGQCFTTHFCVGLSSQKVSARQLKNREHYRSANAIFTQRSERHQIRTYVQILA